MVVFPLGMRVDPFLVGFMRSFEVKAFLRPTVELTFDLFEHGL
jgi:hypothetical protein